MFNLPRLQSGSHRSFEYLVAHDDFGKQLGKLMDQRCKEFIDLLNSQGRKGRMEIIHEFENYACGARILPSLSSKLNRKLSDKNISPEEWLKRFKQDNDEITKKFKSSLDRKNIAGKIRIHAQHTYE